MFCTVYPARTFACKHVCRTLSLSCEKLRSLSRRIKFTYLLIYFPPDLIKSAFYNILATCFGPIHGCRNVDWYSGGVTGWLTYVDWLCRRQGGGGCKHVVVVVLVEMRSIVWQREKLPEDRKRWDEPIVWCYGDSTFAILIHLLCEKIFQTLYWKHTRAQREEMGKKNKSDEKMCKIGTWSSSLTTIRKVPTPSPMVKWSMTSRDPKRSRSWPQNLPNAIFP